MHRSAASDLVQPHQPRPDHRQMHRALPEASQGGTKHTRTPPLTAIAAGAIALVLINAERVRYAIDGGPALALHSAASVYPRCRLGAVPILLTIRQ